MSEKSAVYECVDREHDAWRCRACGYIENFEADGPTENGWHFCPGCGREIIVEAVNPCPFDNDNCMCQFCETPCNNGLNCSDCAHEGKTVHDVLLCTGFNAAYQKSGDYFFVGENVPQIDTKAQRTVLHQPKGVHYELKLAGEHNQYDAQFVERVAELLGCEKEAVLKSMADFEGLPHRLQYVGTYRGVRYYDDSISTIPEAAINAAMSIPDAKTVLIGGMDRGINYDLLVAFIREHKEFQFICAYASGKRIFGEVGDCENCVYAEDLEQAVEAAVQMTEPGGACILSPAAASYGYFKNFEERGETFQKYVHAFAQ